jgi:undecaprenyl-diphosphatase
VLIPAAILFAVLIGLTRLVLLAHFPTQVLGGWLLALAVVPAVARRLLPSVAFPESPDDH